jgi:ankyrin repeat protein
MVQSAQMSRDEPEKFAVYLLALLKYNEDKLVTQLNAIIKKDKAYARDVIMADVDGWTPIHAFALRGCRKLIKLSLRAGVPVDHQMAAPEGVPARCTPLHLAAHRGDVSIVDILLTNGADVNGRNASDHTPIYYASRAHNTLVVRTLRRAGADMSECHPDAKFSIPEDASGSIVNFCFLPFGCSSARR